MEINTNTAVLGAGITGLCVAHAMSREGQSVHLFESHHQVGGALRSTIKDGYLAEHGPNSLLVKDRRVEKLLNDLRINRPMGESGAGCPEIQKARDEATKRYIVQDGKPEAMPSSPMGMIRTPLFSTLGKLRFGLEPFIGKYKGREKGLGEESFAAFVRRRLGPDMLASAAGPFVSGIYAGDPENLSVRHAFPRLWNLENHYGSFILGAIALQFGWGPVGKNPNRLSPAEMISFQSGMQTLPQSIAENLPADSLSLSCQITAIQRLDDAWKLTWDDSSGESHTATYQQLVVAVPHHKLPGLPLPDEIINTLKPLTTLDSPPVTSLVLGFKREDVPHPLDGFGMLIKREEKSPLLGVLFSSSMFDGRAPDGHVTLTCMMGGTVNPQYAENSEQVVLDELHRLLGVTGQPTFRHRSPWQHAIPQYELEYQQIINTLEGCEKANPGLHFAGNYRGGISVGDCIVNGLELGKSLSTF